MNNIQKQTVYNNSLSIPEEARGDFATTVDETIGRINISEPVWVYLFEMYNRFLTTPNGQQNDIGCHHCRYTVLKACRAAVETWKENNSEWLNKE